MQTIMESLQRSYSHNGSFGASNVQLLLLQNVVNWTLNPWLIILFNLLHCKLHPVHPDCTSRLRWDTIKWGWECRMYTVAQLCINILICNTMLTRKRKGQMLQVYNVLQWMGSYTSFIRIRVVCTFYSAGWRWVMAHIKTLSLRSQQHRSWSNLNSNWYFIFCELLLMSKCNNHT